MKNFSKFLVLLPPNWCKTCKTIRYLITTVLLGTFITIQTTEANAQSKPISLSYANTPLSTIFKKITKQSGFTFLYNDDINPQQKVTISIIDSDIENVMKAVLTRTSYKFKVQGSRIVIFIPENNGKQKVTLRIVNMNGAPLSGATITADGIKGGTISDNDGQASLLLNATGSKVIHITYLGYKPTDIIWNGEKEIQVKLVEEPKQFDEVVITGFTTISKERSTGAVTTLGKQEIERKISFDLTTSIEGRIAGFNSYRGANLIRGNTSFLSNAAPLVVVDGLPIEGGINSVNQNDVESVTVLKDAASASIYGSRAANGIIVIVTKSGVKGKTNVDFFTSFSFTPKNRISDYRYASTGDIIDYERSYLENDPLYTANPLRYFQDKNANYYTYSLLQNLYYKELLGEISAADKEAKIQQMRGYDYRKEFEKNIWRDNVMQQYNLSIRKGTDNMDIAFSVNYQNLKFGNVGNSNDILTLNLKNRLNVSKWLTVTYGIYGVLNQSKQGLGAGSATTYMPYERMFDDNGNRNEIVPINYVQNEMLKSIKGLYSMVFNPLSEMEQSYSKNDNTQIRAFTEFNANLLKGLSYNLKLQYQRDQSKQENTFLKESYAMRETINRFAIVNNNQIRYVIPDNGRLETVLENFDNFTVRNQLTYRTNLSNDIALDLFGGTEFRQYKTTGITNDIYGYDPEVNLLGEFVNWDELRKGVYGSLSPFYSQTLTPSQGSRYVLNRDFSIYTNGSLSYKTKYILAGSWRVDKANLFGADPKYKNRPLWSVSASWNASQESFLSAIQWLNRLKVRTSYGINGNVDRSSSPYMLASLNKSIDVNSVYAEIFSAPNPSLRWEKTRILNLGVDFSLFGSFISGSFDYYDKYTTDLIAVANLDPSSGFSSASFNNGKMKNSGYELSLNFNWLENSVWNVSTQLIGAYNKNRITKIDRDPNTAFDLINDPKDYFRVGNPYNSVYAYRYAGITASGDPSVYDKEGKVVENTNLMTDPKALVYMGTYIPPVTGSISQLIRYKNFMLDAQLVVYAGHKLRKDVTALYEGTLASMSADIVNRWTTTNKTSTIPRFPVYGETGDRNKYWKYADIQVQSASMVKLRNIGIAYNLGPKALSKTKLHMVQIKAQVNNVWYWAANSAGIDPENFIAERGSRTGANKSTFLIGLNLTF